MRVPGSSGDSVFHFDSLIKDVEIKIKSGMEASEAEGSPQIREPKGFPGYQTFGRALIIRK